MSAPPGSTEALSWVLDHSRSVHGPRLVLIALAWTADGSGAGIWPDIASLVCMTGLSRASVYGAIRNLRDIGELKTGISPYRMGSRYRIIMTGARP